MLRCPEKLGTVRFENAFPHFSVKTNWKSGSHQFSRAFLSFSIALWKHKLCSFSCDEFPNAEFWSRPLSKCGWRALLDRRHCNASNWSHTKGVDALQASTNLQDAVGFVWNILIFPERPNTLKSQKTPNHTNTRSYETTIITQKKIWKIPNHERDTAKRWRTPQIPGSNVPSGQIAHFESLFFHASGFPENFALFSEHTTSLHLHYPPDITPVMATKQALFS